MEKCILYIFILFAVACSSSKLNDKIKYKDSVSADLVFDKQGHRGCRGLMPENTIPAMLKAIDLGVTTLEMDVVITKDKNVIVSHDPFFNHEITTKPDGGFISANEENKYNIYQMTYEEVKTFDVGLKPHQRFPQQQKMHVTKPLLRELIENVESYIKEKGLQKVFYNIETKSTPEGDNIYHPEPGEFVDLLMNVIKERKIENRVIIQSFDFRTLQYMHKKYASIKTAVLIEDFDKRSLEEQLKDLGFLPSIYSPEYSLVSEQLLTKCHQKNVKVIPWTVNDKMEILRLKKMGVDGLITDYPNLF